MALTLASFSQAGGTFTGGTTAIDINDGSFTLSGGTFTNTSGGLTIERNFTISGGTFTNTGKTITFDDNNSSSDDTTLTASSTLAGSVIINKTNVGATFTLGSNVTIAGDFTRTDGVVSNPASAWTLTVQGNFSMSTTDTFGGANLTLTMGGSGTQTITQNAGSVAGPFQVNKSGGTAALATNFTTSGASGSLITLRSSSTGTTGTQWNINPQGTRSVSYVDVKDSNNTNATAITANNSTNSGNNTNWSFGKSISGIVYTDEGTTSIGANKTVAISVNGGTATTTSTNASSQYTFSSVEISDGAVIIVYLDGQTENGCTVTVVTNADLSGLDIYQKRIILRHDYTTGYTTNVNLATADNGDSDIKYSVSSNNLTLESGQELFIWSGDTYKPGGNLTTADLDIRGTLNIESNTLTVSGNFANSGAFQGTSPTLSFDGYLGTRSSPITFSVTGTLTIKAGGMQDYVSISVKGAGSFSFQEPIPGFVIVNDNILDGIGQQNIRPSLIQGMSGLYQGVMPQPIVAPLVAIMPAIVPVPVVTPASIIAPAIVPAPMIAPTITPAPAVVPPVRPPVLKPSFAGATSIIHLPLRLSESAFAGVNSISILPEAVLAETFINAYSFKQLPPAVSRQIFTGIFAQPGLVEPVSFKGVVSSVVLPGAVKPPFFRGTSSASHLPLVARKEDFYGIIAESILPPSPSIYLRESAAGALLPAVKAKSYFRGASSASTLPAAELPARRDFYGVIAGGELPEAVVKASFAGASILAKLPRVIEEREFSGAVSQEVLSRAQLFSGVIPALNLPLPLPGISFEGAASDAILTRAVSPEAFAGAVASAKLSVFVAQEVFSSAVAQKNLPLSVNPRVFKEAFGAGRIKLMFPGGQKIVPTFGMGVPLGVEKSIMEPRIQEEEE